MRCEMFMYQVQIPCWKTWLGYDLTNSPLPSLFKQDQQETPLTSHASCEVSCSLSSPESTLVSQGSSSSLSNILCPERQSWHNLVNNSSPEEEVDCELSAVSGDPQNPDRLLTDFNKAIENDRAESECGFQNSLSEDASSLDHGNLSMPRSATLRTLPKGKPSRRSRDLAGPFLQSCL